MTMTTNTRYFSSVGGFFDSTAYLRFDRIDSEWIGVVVRKDGSERPAPLRGIAWTDAYIRSGGWRQINQGEAEGLLPEAKTSEQGIRL